ncbi:winged helix-turn-helix domain-containing protein [Catellatospora coxensis]
MIQHVSVPGLSVGVLGRLEIRLAGRPVTVGSRKQRALLSLLLIRPDRFATVDWLTDALWDSAPPPSAETTLRTHVAGLRRALEPDRATGPSP